MSALAHVGGVEVSGSADAAALAEANVDPATGLSTDYLNHFNEAIMLLDMIPAMPECAAELAGWRPLTYRQHFEGSHLRHRAVILAAYEAADPYRRGFFDTICSAMNRMVVMAQDAFRDDVPAEDAAALAVEAAGRLKALAAQANAAIHASTDQITGAAGHEPQAAIDAIFGR